MIDGEPTAASRRIPLDLDDGAGAEYDGAAPTGAEVLISISGAAYTTASGTVTKVRAGDFSYEPTAAESRGRGFRLLRLAKTGMGTATFEWYVGSRRKNDPSAEARRIPIMLELAGVPVTGVTLTGSEVEISASGGAFATGTGAVSEIGYGAYYNEPAVAEYGFRGIGVLNVNDAAADEYKYEFEIGPENSPAPGGTTAEDVRARIATVIAALTPTSLSSDSFREFRNEGKAEFTEWCETKPGGVLRRFQVTETGSDVPPEASSVTDEERHALFRVVVAYPQTARYGEDQAVDRYRVMREDQRIIENAIGMTGKANFSSPYPDATWLMDGSGADRESGEACDYLIITQRMFFTITR